jgi:hypothetical protein
MVQATESRGERRKLETRLDEALTQTFPASDPFSVGHATGTEPPSRPIDVEPPVLPPQGGRRRSRRAAARPQHGRP